LIARIGLSSVGQSNMTIDESSAAGALNTIFRVLEQLDQDARLRVLKAVETFFSF
jgi:hypothetical protein